MARFIGVSELRFGGEYVYGVITVNNDKKIKAEYDRLMAEDEELAKAYYEEIYGDRRHSDRVQKMLKVDFYALME